MQVRSAVYIVLTLLSWGIRLCAVGVCALTAALCFSALSGLGPVAALSAQLAYALPARVAGYGLIASPFGGVFRLDFAILAAVLFLLDFACSWAASKVL